MAENADHNADGNANRDSGADADAQTPIEHNGLVADETDTGSTGVLERVKAVITEAVGVVTIAVIDAV